MPTALATSDEAARLSALQNYRVLDSAPEPEFDRLARLAAHVMSTPIALVSLVDSERQWSKACLGLAVRETPREHAFCAHAIQSCDPLVVEDATLDDRFAHNPLVTGEPGIRFYAAAPLITASGKAIGTICTIDQTPRSATKEQVEALQELARIAIDELEHRRSREAPRASRPEWSHEELEQFARVAAHEVRAPLRHIGGFARLIESEHESVLGEDAREWLNNIGDATVRLDTLTHDLASYVRLMWDTEPLSRVDLAEVVDECVSLLESEMEESDAILTRDPLPELGCARGQISQLLQHLLGNALKYRSDHAPRIHVSCDETASHIVLRVRDNGIGIDPKHRDRIFAPFKRLHGRQSYAGSGLGLAASLLIAERHGGTLSVDSTEGRGSTFQVSLPKSPPEPR